MYDAIAVGRSRTFRRVPKRGGHPSGSSHPTVRSTSRCSRGRGPDWHLDRIDGLDTHHLWYAARAEWVDKLDPREVSAESASRAVEVVCNPAEQRSSARRPEQMWRLER
ncbi:hypothetical protein EF294_05455 [Gordonia oryzae]|uniref:Uncharacterized protein n=1 Tax=Gordonia oryzae TaxID=2487349 RepID=A0A3N4GQW0_9ACTN|nr:hypothetical protein EF294_05455 [Gordonia oryzae]